MIGTVSIIIGIVVIPMVIMAIFLLNGKGAFLIAGYNTMSKEEKAKYDEKTLCRFAGRLLIIVSFCLLLFSAGLYFDAAWLIYCGIAAMLASVIGAVIYANTGNRFRINNDAEVPAANENNKTKSKAVIVAVIVISAIMLIALGILLYQGGKDPVVNILDNSVQIKAMYGLSIDFTDITDISLIEKNMRDIGIHDSHRISGYSGFGDSLKGHYKSESLGETLLFVQSKTSPTIRIECRNHKDIYISFSNSEKTSQVYSELITAVK